ncbi:MAG: poly-beta-1,6-N-acetyl-D-glucosamine biosynthesis protein PgaD [Magnetospirillum sp.]|nr:poly-beta-1,6-N-acetyl-D-glucosamine biosynthesis protein PgaD [Magnetospirillum sp.]
MKHLIIDARQCRSPSQCMLDLVLTTALWVFYLVLVHEAALFAAAVAGWLVNPTGAWLSHRFAAVLPTLLSYAEVAAINAGLLFAWAAYNRLRFAGRERRRGSVVVTAGDVARFYHVTEAEILEWREARRLVVHHDSAGMITRVEAGMPQWPCMPAFDEQAA